MYLLPIGDTVCENEQSLFCDLARGDGRAFATLMERYLNMVYSIACGMLGNHADAEDVCQEVFLRLHRRAATLTSHHSLRLWLYRTCLNCCLDELRRRSRRPVLSSGAGMELIESGVQGPEQLAANRGFDSQVISCLLQLPPRQRAVFTLRHFVGLTIAEISATLGCAPGTVKCHLSRSLAAIREMLPDWQS